jgi:hypothetical protein
MSGGPLRRSGDGEPVCGMNRRSFRYRIVDLAGLALEDVELTVQLRPGETIRAGDGTLMVVSEVVDTPDDPAYAGVLIVEPAPSSALQ